MEAVWLNIQNWFNTRLTADVKLAVNQRIKAVKRGSTTDVKKEVLWCTNIIICH